MFTAWFGAIDVLEKNFIEIENPRAAAHVDEPRAFSKFQAVLEVFREAGGPISVSDCAATFAIKLGVLCEPANLSDIARRLSVVLAQLTTAGCVRQSGQFEGRKVLWEVAYPIRSGGLFPCQYPQR